MKGLLECISRMVPDLATQDKILVELDLYISLKDLFVTPMAIRKRKTLAPGKNIFFHISLIVVLFLVLSTYF